MCSCMLVDTGSLFMFVSGYRRFVHVRLWTMGVCTCLVVGAGGVFMFVSEYWRYVHVS